MRTLTKDQTFSTSTVVNGDKVHVRYASKPNDQSPVRYVFDKDIDFTDVSKDELMRLATAHVKVVEANMFRARVKKDGDGVLKDETLFSKAFSVRDYLDGRPVRQDPVAKAKSLFAGLTAEQRAEVLANLK